MKRKHKAISLICAGLMLSSALCGCAGTSGNNDSSTSAASNSVRYGHSRRLAASSEDTLSVSASDFSQKAPEIVANLGVSLLQSNLRDKNALVSPLSLFTALSMTANGADGETLSQMESVLGASVEDLNSFSEKYMKELASSGAYKVYLANSVWFRDSDKLSIEDSFLQKLNQFYRAEAFAAPFDQTTLSDINDWVSENTDEMIKNPLDQINPATMMYLINTLCFDAKWNKSYEKSDIRNRLFKMEDGAERKVPFLHSTENMYLEDDITTGFIKYYKDKHYAFVGLLPEYGITTEDYINSLSGEKIMNLINSASRDEVIVSIPKFTADYKIHLPEILSSMGMENAFDPEKADFSNINGQKDLYVSDVIHQTHLELDENGTKASAATIVEMSKNAADIGTYKYVNLDRPFVYILLDCDHNVPLFIGRCDSL